MEVPPDICLPCVCFLATAGAPQRALCQGAGDDASWTGRWRPSRTGAASTPRPALSGFRHGVLSADLLQTYAEYKFIQNSSTSLGAGQLLPVVLHRA